MQLLSRLQLWQKLALLVVAMAVPTSLVGWFYVSTATQQVSQARLERDGGRYLDALGLFASEVVSHHARVFTFLNGDTARKSEVISEQAEVDKRVAAVDQVNGELGKKLGAADSWEALKSEWASLKSKALQQSADESDASHAAVMAHVQQLRDLVSVKSRLAADPDVGTRTLIHMASDYAPTTLIAAGNMRLRAVRAAIKGYLGGDDRMGIKIFHNRVLSQLENIRNDQSSLSPEVAARLQPVIAQANSAAGEFYAALEAKILNVSEMKSTGNDIYEAGVPADRAINDLCTASYEALRGALDKRASDLAFRRDWTGGVSALALALAIALSWLITQSLARPLKSAISVFERISDGHYDNQIETGGTDEAGLVLRALDEMQAKLRTQIETERAVAAENTRIRQALDQASTSVVLADAHHQIIYLNDDRPGELHAQPAGDPQDSPNFDAGALARLEPRCAVHRSGAGAPHARHLSGADVQERVLGEFTFSTVTNPVIDEQGERLGTVMEWTQRTQEVRVEKELQGMLTAVNGGDLSKRIDLAGKTGFFEAMSRGINQLADNLTEIVSQVKDAAAEVHRGARGDLRGQLQPVAAHRGAGFLARGDRLLDGGDDHDRQAERRQRRPGQPARHRRARAGRARRPGRRQGRAGHVRHQRLRQEDRRHHRRDRRDRVPDQPAGAQRGRRSRARRRAGPRLRGSRLRGAQPRRPLGDCREGDQGPHPGQRQEGRATARCW